MIITIVFLNNGSAVAKFEDSTYTYVHFYDDMKQLAEDYYSVISDGLDGSTLSHWDGNEPEMWGDDWRGCLVYEGNNEESIDNIFAELSPDWGYNVGLFIENLNRLRNHGA